MEITKSNTENIISFLFELANRNDPDVGKIIRKNKSEF